LTRIKLPITYQSFTPVDPVDPVDPCIMPPKAAPTNFTDDQNAQLFAIALATAQSKAEDEKTVAKEKADLEKQILLDEFKARIQAIIAAPLIKSSASLIHDNDDDEGETPPEIKAHRTRFAGLPGDEIIKIFIGKFKSINIYKLRHMRGLAHDFYYDQDRIGIENGQLKSLKKTMGTYKDFGKIFYEVYSEFFINYLLIVTTLFATTSSDIGVTLIKFYQKILELAKLYDWESAVLSLAIEIHTHAAAQGIIEADNWNIDSDFQGRYCHPGALNGTKSFSQNVSSLMKRKRSLERLGRFEKKLGSFNILTVLCEAYNRHTGCNVPSCERLHQCKGCGTKGHGLATCRKA
jgi:hypothetical protein